MVSDVLVHKEMSEPLKYYKKRKDLIIEKCFADDFCRQNFILRGRFPRESCRSHRDLQLSLGNLGLRMKFCLEFWSIFVDLMRSDLSCNFVAKVEVGDFDKDRLISPQDGLLRES